jgi:hypothetical protein
MPVAASIWLNRFAARPNYFLRMRKTIPVPSRKLFWRLLSPLGTVVMKYSACTGRTETYSDTLKSMPPPAVKAKLFWIPERPIPEVVAMPPKRSEQME